MEIEAYSFGSMKINGREFTAGSIGHSIGHILEGSRIGFSQRNKTKNIQTK